MTTTTYWPAETREAGISEAAAVLASGGIVAFPTETVYGLGADARNPDAVNRIFAAKGRPSDNPLIVHVAEQENVAQLAQGVTALERRLMNAFWPGPLTLVLPVKPGAVSELVTAGLDTVAVRMPAHPVARRLIAESGCPLAAPSANRSGRPSPTKAGHVREDLDGRIDGLLDGGATGVGLESTVVRVLDGTIHVLRPGGVTAEQLAEATGAPVAAGAAEEAGGGADKPRSPGVKYAHYAPQGEMRLVVGEPAAMAAAIQAAASEARREGLRVGVLASEEHAGVYRGVADAVLALGPRTSPETAAQALYASLRECDERGLDLVLAEAFPETGIGAALRNRMIKAAGGRVLTV